MKFNVSILCLFIIGLSFQAQARNYKGLSIGANAAYNSYSKFDFEGFTQANLQLGRVPFEPKLGLTCRSFVTDYKRLSNLNVNSFGLFLGSDVYPFKKIFYTGLRFGIDINRFSDKTMNVLEQSNEHVTRFFPGFRAHAAVGVDLPISNRISLRLSGTPGWQFYILSDNWSISSDSGINISTRNGTAYSRFVYQFNVGIAIKLWKRQH
jgi:hypothetical protein